MTAPRNKSGFTGVPSGRADCSSKKVGYSTRKKAREVRTRMPDGKGLNIYRCPECAWYHLGHLPQRVKNGEVDKADWLDATVAKRPRRRPKFTPNDLARRVNRKDAS